MAKFTPITRDTHQDQVWRRLRHYSFAATEGYVPIAGAEIARAALAMPVGFVETAGKYMPVAILALALRQNLFVAPDGPQAW